ncbi:phage major capsid protein [Phaeovulum vinaykumarii]|uniref:Phage prohead protease, HK97 family/phage major capsid protein, HK97 family,TIGR01554 n=1 Tax=Phaeovulum vinaykumarii TaxID=407234 RepID=A0A1N7K669_9RHOB|nr:phage major capsid protein [Phaeovulum vinaykumarii]SIS57047.1 phage prohead protease, HK97 family/phage major capsid protein, HK97 family,TIGR01554 [Phaeovulum vinaykumarii]SOB93246.1 HK97 family phage prohead protease/HK97 family phage major capsid protein,TIGR01554 [Phaeovulum vinaykumarii]
MTDRLEIKAQLAASEAGEITGLAWPFGSADRVGDVIVKGAFSAPSALPMLFAHDQAQVIGVWDEIAETEAGLTVKGRLLIEDVERAREVRAMVKAGAVSGLSIGFVTKDARRAGRGRRITALELHEISIVAVPAHPGAQITSLKSTHLQKEHSAMEQEDTAVPAPQIDTKAFDEIKSRLDKLEAKSNRPSLAVTGVQSPVMAADEVKGFVHYLRTGDKSETKSLAYGAPSTGGILAPETVSTSIISKIAEQSPVRGLASVIAMSGPLLQLPRLVTEVAPQHVTETETRPESEPTFEQIDLKPHEMAVIVPVTRVLLEDAQVDLNSYLSAHIARSFGQLEARWFVTGNGTTAAEGVMTSAEVQECEVTGLTADELIDLYYALKTPYAQNGAWLMNRKTMAAVRKLKDGNGDFLWQPALAGGQPGTLLGRPVYEAPDMEDAAAGKTPIVFGDFASGYTIADHTGFSIMRDDYTGAANGIIKLHARRRVGGRVTLGEALAKLKLAA